MTEPRPPGVGEDAAWARVQTRLPRDALRELLTDPELLLRVNPHWTFEGWSVEPPDRFHLRLNNLANRQVWETGGRIERQPDALVLHYDEGIKASTRFQLDTVDGTTQLWVIDDYSRLPEAEREQRLGEVDPSLPGWASALKRFLDAWARWSGVGAWRWYMRGPWRRMTPLGRRVARLLIWATVAELALFALLVAVLVVELGGD